MTNLWSRYNEKRHRLSVSPPIIGPSVGPSAGTQHRARKALAGKSTMTTGNRRSGEPSSSASGERRAERSGVLDAVQASAQLPAGLASHLQSFVRSLPGRSQASEPQEGESGGMRSAAAFMASIFGGARNGGRGILISRSRDGLRSLWEHVAFFSFSRWIGCANSNISK